MRDGLLEDFHRAGLYIDDEVVKAPHGIAGVTPGRRPVVVMRAPWIAAGLIGFALGNLGMYATTYASGGWQNGVLNPDTIYVEAWTPPEPQWTYPDSVWQYGSFDIEERTP